MQNGTKSGVKPQGWRRSCFICKVILYSLVNNNGGDNLAKKQVLSRFCWNTINWGIHFINFIALALEDEVATRYKSDLYSELLPAMSVEACVTAKDGKVPALKTLLTNPATRAAIDQLFEVPPWGVSIIKLPVELLHHLPPHRLLFLSTTTCLCAVHAWMRVVGACCT